MIFRGKARSLLLEQSTVMSYTWVGFNFACKIYARLALTNTLAYHGTDFTVHVKSFIVQAHGNHMIVRRFFKESQRS